MKFTSYFLGWLLFGSIMCYIEYISWPSIKVLVWRDKYLLHLNHVQNSTPKTLLTQHMIDTTDLQWNQFSSRAEPLTLHHNHDMECVPPPSSIQCPLMHTQHICSIKNLWLLNGKFYVSGDNQSLPYTLVQHHADHNIVIYDLASYNGKRHVTEIWRLVKCLCISCFFTCTLTYFESPHTGMVSLLFIIVFSHMPMHT